ncbi:sodium:calcium antiporter [Oxalobacteraceae bacterium R-40]|uniref:Sodium:calcium antiporter n=1 Tax=Keguizhuia sedimenti TaxID=3064264 RepID=A0ABU1BSX7_9BURK|nr:sodium:calcium antiporter [Oxalobacteraceae bacterium R-40]
MEFLNFKENALWINIAAFCVTAVVVWIAGTRIARYADKIATATGLGHAAVGLVLLAGITSLPEVAVSVTAAAEGSPALAVNNLLGSIAMQIAILAVADAIIGRDALTSVVASPIILLQVAMNALLLVFVAAAISIGDRPLFSAGAWSWSMLILYGFAIWKISTSQGRQHWMAKKSAHQKEQEEIRKKKQQENNSDDQNGNLKALIMKTVAAGAAILVAGFLLSRTGDAIAQQTGLGQSFVGAVLIAVSTSLPELSSVISAVRLGRYEMAISDIFGTNLFNVGLIFLVDVVYRDGLVVNEIGQFSLFASLLGIAMASIYLIGLIERRDRTVARMGIDSFAVLLSYIGGLFMLYQLR